MLRIETLALLSLLLVPFAPSIAMGGPPSQEDGRLEGEALEEMIEELATLLSERYVFEDVGADLAEKLRTRMWEGAYEGVSLAVLAGRLTSDLQSVNGDRHLNVRVRPRDLPREDEDLEEARRRMEEQARRTNHGFAKLEILAGNIGYMDLRGFASADEAGPTAVAAMGFLANVDALVIDLRRNGGGDPTMIQLLSSYFFDEPTLLNTFQWRGQERIDQFWTLPHVPGPKLTDVPLFVLTSGRTFSAAEEFTYNLKNLERATIVGQTTGGGAHPGGTHAVGPLGIFIPNGRAINPITETNWEGTGIEPNIEVPVERALERALSEARKQIASEYDPAR
jgi:hypothetical protein